MTEQKKLARYLDVEVGDPNVKITVSAPADFAAAILEAIASELREV